MKEATMKKLTWFLPLIIIVVATGCTNPHTPAGSEGYVYESPRIWGKGGFRGIIKGPGNYGVSAWRNKVMNIDIRPQTYLEKFRILAKDNLNVGINAQAIILIKPGGSKSVVELYGGGDWYKRFIKEPLRSYVRQVVPEYSSWELKNKRQEISDKVAKQLVVYLVDSPFELVKLVIGNIDYPDIVVSAVEKKMAAQQLLEEKVIQKEIAQKNAEIRIEEAKGIARSQEIINKTLTRNYLQHEAIQAQVSMAESPNHTTVYIPVGPNGMPIMLDVSEK
ncbi:MAG TPA: hypothetical protein ENH12_00990 [Proteobacteria bacterium]|nr:hypothetical protein [Pseudomonadota bacterium]